MAELLFHGAAGEVTGSMHMVRMDGRWIALDCGLFQGRRSESEEKNRLWPVPPKEIAAVVLSHAHTDHAGRLPLLSREGFEGPIFCTPATRDLCAVMLPDSAHIQVEDVSYVNKKRGKKGLPPVEPLYEHHDALAAVHLMQTVDMNQWFAVADGIRARFNEAGHMLGAAGIELALGKRDGDAPTLYFTGDVGRFDKPILRDPAPFPPCETIICESTYGGRVTEDVEHARDRMIDVMRRTFERGGKVIIPAFSVGRTQTIVYFMHQWMLSGDLPQHPIYVDSPLAINATEVFRMHPECYDADARELHQATGDILGGDACTYVRDVEESKALHMRRDPCTIIAGSGMCEAGRIRHHLRNNISNERNTILFPGFQAEGTLGRRIVDGAREVTIFHENFRVRAEVVQLEGFSAHADQTLLLQYLRQHAGVTKRIFLVHGETPQAEALRAELEGTFPEVHVAQRGQQISL